MVCEDMELENSSPSQSWQFSANSIHYLLGFWQRLVGSVPYIRSTEPHLLDTYMPEVRGQGAGFTVAMVSSLLSDHKCLHHLSFGGHGVCGERKP